MNRNDAIYVEDSRELVAEWLTAMKEDSSIGPEVLWRCIRDQADLCVRIHGGADSPWHDDLPKEYLSVMAALRRP